MPDNDWRCCTCGYETPNVNELACGHWRNCLHYATAHAAGTLPTDSSSYTKGNLMPDA